MTYRFRARYAGRGHVQRLDRGASGRAEAQNPGRGTGGAGPDDGGYSSEEDEAGNQIKRSGPGVRAMRQKKRAEELQEKRLS